MAPRRSLPLVVLILLVVSVPASAAVRLTTSVNGTIVEVTWPPEAFPIRYAADQRLVTALPGGTAMLDRAFEAWASVPQTRVSFASRGVAGSLKAGKDGVNTITLTDDLYANQKAIAITTNWDDNGTLIESDIQVDTSLIRSAYNVQQAITHEVGHLLGLDHSAVLSAVMFPYVSRGSHEVVLDSDERVAIAAMYPAAGIGGGILRGRVTGDTGGIFAAQVVALNEFGEPVATALTDTAGDFTLHGVPDGTYRIYAEPLDGPVDPRNLSPYWRQTAAQSFPTEFHRGDPITVSSGRVYGNLIVSTAGAADLNPRWVAAAKPGSSLFTLATTAAVVRAGDTIALAVAGDGMLTGVTEFEVLNPSVRRISPFRYGSNYVYADFAVDADAPAASAVILVTRGPQTAALTGALRVESTDPTPRRRLARR